MANISPPTLLATFQTSHASSSKNRHVSLSPVLGSEGELAVLAVHGDGVWTYDLKTLRPTTSYTVPPTTSFSSHPLSFIPSNSPGLIKGKGKASPQDEDAEMSSSIATEDAVETGPRRTTLVGVESAENGKGGKRSGEIWCWRGDDDEKTVIHADHVIQSLLKTTSPQYPVLAISADGSMFLLDLADQLVPLQHTAFTGDIISSKIITTTGDSTGVVLVGSTGKVSSFRIDHPEDGACSARLTAQSSTTTAKLSVADVSEDGTVTTVDTALKLSSRNIRTSSESSKNTNLAYIATAPALVSVPSTQPLIFHAVTKPTTTLILSLLGSESPVILAANDISSLSTDGEVSNVSLLGKSFTAAWIVGFTVWHKHGDKDSGRSVVYTCELTLPEKGFGMNLLLGSQQLTATYVEQLPRPQAQVPKGKRSVAAEPLEIPKPSGRDAELATLLEGSLDAEKWQTVREIMRTTKTLRSSTLVVIIKRAIDDHCIRQTYIDFLSLSPPAIDFRFELRRNVSVEEATGLLALLVEWCDQWCQHRTTGLGWPDAISTAKSPVATIPSLDSIIAHSSLLLDSHLPLFVDYDSAAPLLESLSASLVPLLALQAEIRLLRAPVDALLTLSKRDERRRAEVKAKQESMRPMGMNSGGGGGVKRLGAPKPGAGALLQGQDFGKWKVEDFVF